MKNEESLSEIGLRRRNIMNQSSRILSNQMSIATSTTSQKKSSTDPPDRKISINVFLLLVNILNNF